jgi:retron-type reverse transcriptase
MGWPNLARDTRDAEASGSAGARSRSGRPRVARQSEVSREITEKAEVKDSEVLVKVFDPGRLLEAWQQVRRNAGAAKIDQMTVEEFTQREEQLLALIHDKLESGTYRFQPA